MFSRGCYKCQTTAISKPYSHTKFGHILMLSVWTFSLTWGYNFSECSKELKFPKYSSFQRYSQTYFQFQWKVLLLLFPPAFQKPTPNIISVGNFPWKKEDVVFQTPLRKFQFKLKTWGNYGQLNPGVLSWELTGYFRNRLSHVKGAFNFCVMRLLMAHFKCWKYIRS